MGTDDHEEAGWIQRVLIGRNPKRTLVRILVLVLTSFVVFKFVLLPIRVQGISMLPTYHDGNINFINRLAFKLREPRRGDIVGIRYSGPHALLLKRIIALPGETLTFRHGQAFINGVPLDEPYLKRPCTWDIPSEVIRPDSYYVVGDNRDMPEGDHTKGQARRERIVGRILL